MLNNIGQSAAVKAVVKPDGAVRDALKQGASRFDEVRANLQERASAVQLPPEVTQLSNEDRMRVAHELRLNIERSKQPPAEVGRVEMKNTEMRIESLRDRVKTLPPEPVFEPLRARFNNIETVFQRSADYLNGLSGKDSPADVLKIQLEMYQLSQNIELVSKVVDQVNGGIKSILQTQV